MTLLEQLLSPAVMEWTKANRHLSKEQKMNEFDKWFANNVELINESAKNNIDHINERLEDGLKNAKLLVENVSDDDFDWGVDAVEDDGDDDNVEDDDSKDADTSTSANDMVEDDDVDITISKKYVLTNSFKNPKTNVFACVNAFYKDMEDAGISRDDNPHIWGRLDVKKVTNMTALFAFADIANADLSSWDTSNVKLMEGMFYKSTFNNNSISRWNVGSCENFLRIFTFCDFSGDITHWNLKEIEVPQLDNLGNAVKINGKVKMVKTTVNPPLIGANANEELERVNKFWGGVLKGFIDDKDKKNIQEENKTMKHILDYETFIINEGLGDVFKKGFNKIKSFFKNATMKFGNFIASFNDKGEIMNASDPYTALNYIADGKVEGVSAYTDVKNEFLNDNVKSTARLIENPEYYGIIDKNSIEYQNYLTMVEMVNEHYSKYGDKLNEAKSERVGFSAESGGLEDAVNITSEELLDEIDDIILNTPYEKGEDASKPILIWGAPGIGKSTIPNAVIKAWNSKSAKKKTLMVVECGNLTVDGFALPMPTTKTIGQYMKERPEAAQNIIDQIGDIEKAISEIEIQLSDDVVKKWVPVYRETANKAENIAQNEIANGGRISEYVKDEKTGKFRKETIETTEGGLLLFDEFFRANPQVFKILMQLLLNRRFNNDFVLGDKWAMMACSNRPNDDEEVSNGFETTGAVIGTRFKDQYNFIPDFDEWKKWAVKDGHFDEGTLSFLVLKKDPTTGEYINWHTIRPNEYTKGKTGWPTPRTWSGLMSDLHNYMTNHNYSSISQIPDRVIERKAGGAIGRKLGLEYTEYIKKYYSNFNPADILNKSDYTISDDMTPSEVFNRLGTYIDSTFDKTNPPSDNQMMNMFNTLERTFDGGKGNYAKVLYTSALEKFGIHDADATDRILKIFPNFIVAIAKKYKLLAMVKVDGKIKPDTNFTIENIQDFCNGDEPRHK